MTEHKCAQRYSLEGEKGLMNFYINDNYYSDQILLLHFVTRFLKHSNIEKMEFMEYKGFNAAKVTSDNDCPFYITIEPWVGELPVND